MTKGNEEVVDDFKKLQKLRKEYDELKERHGGLKSKYDVLHKQYTHMWQQTVEQYMPQLTKACAQQVAIAQINTINYDGIELIKIHLPEINLTMTP